MYKPINKNRRRDRRLFLMCKYHLSGHLKLYYFNRHFTKGHKVVTDSFAASPRPVAPFLPGYVVGQVIYIACHLSVSEKLLAFRI